jgi:hypothetical protein
MMADAPDKGTSATAEEVQTFWTIYSQSKGGLSFSFEKGKKIVVVFTSMDKARSFIKAAELDAKDWLFLELPPHGFVEWLRIQIKDGKHLVSLDPPDDRAVRKATSILNVLIKVE